MYAHWKMPNGLSDAEDRHGMISIRCWMGGYKFYATLLSIATLFIIRIG
jgi:hypothetical protein